MADRGLLTSACLFLLLIFNQPSQSHASTIYAEKDKQVTCWTGKHLMFLNKTTTVNSPVWDTITVETRRGITENFGVGFSYYADPYAVQGSCKIEIGKAKQTEIFCHQPDSGAPYYDRYRQNLVVLIYTRSGAMSLTRLVKEKKVKSQRVQRVS